MKIESTIVLAVIALSIAASCAVAQSIDTPTSPAVSTSAVPAFSTQPLGADAGFFYDQLLPYGQWFWLEPYGWVWTPNNVDVGWRPYTDGSWAYTDCGWTWVSDAPWGWAPYHYGRWFFHEHRGWCWMPDRVWGPGWVSWHFGDAWCGWAPLPPLVAWETTVNWDVLIPPFAWCFVGREDFLRPHLHKHIVVAARNVTLLRETRNVTKFEIRDRRIINNSLGVDQIERFTGKSVPRMKLTDVNSPSVARRASGGELRVFRPAPTPGAVAIMPRTTSRPVVRPSPATSLDELRRNEAERARVEAAQRAQRENLERWHQRELQQPPRGLSAGELQQRHEAEHRAFNEQLDRERQVFEHRAQPQQNRPAPPPMYGRRNNR